MTNASWLALPLLLSTQVDAPTPAADAKPASEAPASEAPAAETPKSVSLVEQAHRIVEVEANTAANLKRAIALYDEALADAALPEDRRVKALIDQSRAYQRLGELVKSGKEKEAAFQAGQQAGAKARKLAPKNPDAIFWETANLASLGRARGVMNSLFMVGDVKKGLEEVLRLDPNHAYARNTLAKVYHAVPGFAGGSDEKAEELLLENLKRRPRFTPSMVELGRFYVDEGRKDEARAMFQRVLDEKKPEPRNDYRKFNLPDAKRELANLGSK